jgi:hypothetical protein
MKKTALCLFTLLALFSNSALAQRKLNERRAVVPNGFMRIFSLSGSVTVIGWDRDSLVVTGTVWEPSGDRFAVGVTPKGAKLGLWSDSDAPTKPSHIVVYVPSRSQVWVKTTSADIRVSKVSGGLDLFSVSGSITIGDAPREVYAETMGGDVVLDANTSSARIKTAGGTLRVTGTIADLTAVTVSGPINVASANFQRARIESVDGDIRISGAIPRGSGLDVTNHAGAIDLLLPPDATADFAVSLYSGELVDEFGVAKKQVGGSKMKARELVFALGEKPVARVSLRSFKGRIALRKQ